VIGAQAPLGEQLFDIAVRKGKAQIPANRQHDDLRFELPPPEKTRNRMREQEHRSSLSDHSCKVATLPVKNLFASLRCRESLALGLVNRHNTGFYAAIHYSN
jgi:hypothetical protein